MGYEKWGRQITFSTLKTKVNSQYPEISKWISESINVGRLGYFWMESLFKQALNYYIVFSL